MAERGGSPRRSLAVAAGALALLVLAWALGTGHLGVLTSSGMPSAAVPRPSTPAGTSSSTTTPPTTTTAPVTPTPTGPAATDPLTVVALGDSVPSAGTCDCTGYVERLGTSLHGETGRPVVGIRPVTDTVKVVADGAAGQVVGETLDRDALVAVASPLVVPAAVLASLPRWPSADLARAVADLAAAGHAVETLESPPEGRRVSSPDDVRLLDALTAPLG